MSTIPCPTPHCDRPRPGNRHLCGACEAELARALGDVAWLAGELDVVLSRQGSHTAGVRSAGVPLPYDPRASEAAAVLKSALVGWVRELLSWHAEEWPADDLADIAAWLLVRVERLVMHPAAEEAVGEICSAVRAAVRLVDRPVERVYAGPCGAEKDGQECPEALYARPDAVRVTCRACGAVYDVADRREQMLDSIGDLLLVAAQAAHVLTLLGEECTGERIRQWAFRGRVLAHGHDGQGRPLYRISELREQRAKTQRRERMSA